MLLKGAVDLNLIDIHSHILPEIDDGAKNSEEAIKLLKLMKEQGITDVVATPHFIASEQNLQEFLSSVNDAKNELDSATKGLQLPNIYFGSEVYYFSGIGNSNAIKHVCLNKSKYLLLELPFCDIDKYVLDDIIKLRTKLDIIPIIAHIERYHKLKGYRKLLKLVQENTCIAQLNAASVLLPSLKRRSYKLIKKGYISIIATDTHSLDRRPPRLLEALEDIKLRLGKSYSDRLIENLSAFQKEITCK